MGCAKKYSKDNKDVDTIFDRAPKKHKWQVEQNQKIVSVSQGNGAANNMCLSLSDRNPKWIIVKAGNEKPDNKQVAENHWVDKLARDRLRTQTGETIFTPDEIRTAKAEILLSADVICSTAASSALSDLK